jgi:glycosyltransferase involved in cell wall biosynthesis
MVCRKELVMRLLIAVEHHFVQGPDGHIYSHGPAGYKFWQRYLEVFEEVVVLGRVGRRAADSNGLVRADGPGAIFWPLVEYLGPGQYLRRVRKLCSTVGDAVRHSPACLLRVPGLVGRLVGREIRRARRPYGVEVVGDPWEALGPGTIRSAFRPVYRRIAQANLRSLCKGAAAVAYVTAGSLQRRYPPAREALTAHYSSVDLGGAFADEEVLADRRRRLQNLVRGGTDSQAPIRIGFVGSLAQLYKGPDTLIRAAALCLGHAAKLEFVLLGDGRYRSHLEALARRLGIDERVRFLGQLSPGEQVYRFLDGIALLVAPSRAEGLPRVVLEAMARGCPCIGSTAGGIPELLPADDLVPAGDVRGLARKILEVLRDPERMIRMSVRNVERAGDYREERLAQRRRAFYRYLKEQTLAWLGRAA